MNNTAAPVPAVETMSTEDAIKEWLNLKQWAANAKTRELQLRAAIFKTLFPADTAKADKYKEKREFSSKTGTYVAAAERDIKREIVTEQMKAAMDKAELPAEVRASLIRVKYELSVTEYKKLNPGQQAALADMIIIKPQSLELEISFVPFA